MNATQDAPAWLSGMSTPGNQLKPAQHPLNNVHGPCQPKAAPRKQRRTPEHDLQKAVAAMLDQELPLDAWWTSIDHAHSSKRARMELHVRGVKPGIADILVLWRHVAAWPELKAPNGYPSAAQLKFAEAVQAAGHEWAICHSVAEVRSFLLSCGIPLCNQVPA